MLTKLQKKVRKELWLLKEGAVVGLGIGLLIYYLPIPSILIFVDDWFGPFASNQLLLATLFLTVSAGIIFDFFYKPEK